MSDYEVASDGTLIHRSDLLTVKQYADMFGVHVQTVYSTIRNGTLQHHVVRIGRAIRIDVSRETIPERKAS